MAAYGDKRQIINYDELPKINGEYIKAIYAMKYDPYFHKFTDARGNEEPDYYHCVSYFNLHSGRDLYIRKLPEGLQEIFDSGDRITNLWIRTSCSGNGSFVDSSFYGQTANGKYISYSRGFNYEVTPFAQALLNSLGKEYTCEELKEHEYTIYKNMPIQFVDGKVYPDKQCGGWRNCHDMPFVSNDGYNLDNIRVLNTTIQSHVYLSKIEDPQEGDEGFIVSQGRSQAEGFITIRMWANRPGAENQMIRFRVVKKGKELTSQAIINDKFADGVYGYTGDLYRVVKIVDANL